MVNRLSANLDAINNALSTQAHMPVAIEYVSAQLNELWRDVAEAAQARGGVQGVTTAQVLNLVIHAGTHEAANEYLKDMNLITGRHPCRIISMVTEGDEEEMAVQAWVSLFCQLPPSGGRQVCCEQVTVAACGQATRQIPAAVIPLLTPGLPVFLWWPRGQPFDDYLFRNLDDSLDRLIVDSATFENPEGTLGKMHEMLRNNWPNTACTDMNWGRITRWRELMAQFFDSQLLRPYLDRVSRVNIRFALSERGAINRVQGMLMAGWLASRLDWQPTDQVYQLVQLEGEDHPSARLSLRHGKQPITVTMNAGPWRGPIPGELNSVELQVLAPGSKDEVEACFTVSLSEEEDECAWTCVEVQGEEQTRRHVQMNQLSRAELLDQELEVFSHDRVYEESLEMAGRFIRGIAGAQPSTDARRISAGEPMSAGAYRVRPPAGEQK